MLGDRIDRADRARENRVNAQGLTRLLGLLSLGMGVALVAPRALGRLLGLGGERPWLLRAIAARDVAIGIGLLGSPDPTPWLRAQAAADVLDAGILVESLRRGRGNRARATLWLVFASAMAGLAGWLSASRESRVVGRE
jgi:hypothetical protein